MTDNTINKWKKRQTMAVKTLQRTPCKKKGGVLGC